VPAMFPEPVLVARSPKQRALGAANPRMATAPLAASKSTPTTVAHSRGPALDPLKTIPDLPIGACSPACTPAFDTNPHNTWCLTANSSVLCR
jgi:hypothetical protein